MSEQVLLTILTAVGGAISAAIVALWRRTQELDARGDALAASNAQLQAQVATLQAELARERQRNTELQHQVTTLQSDLEEARSKIAELERTNVRLKDENRIFRSAFEKQGVKVATPDRRADDAQVEAQAPALPTRRRRAADRSREED